MWQFMSTTGMNGRGFMRMIAESLEKTEAEETDFINILYATKRLGNSLKMKVTKMIMIVPIAIIVILKSIVVKMMTTIIESVSVRLI